MRWGLKDLGNLRRQNGSLSTTFRNILILQGLCRGQSIVLVKPIKIRNTAAKSRREYPQHTLVNRVCPKILSATCWLRRVRDTHSLFLEPTIRIPPRATSLNRIWNPRNSLPMQDPISSKQDRTEMRIPTNDNKHSKRLLRILDLR